MDRASIEIHQRHLLCEQTLILNGDALKVESRRGLSLTEYRFDLRGFLPHPTRVKQVPMVRIILCGLLTVLAFSLGYLGISETVEFLAGLLILILVLCWARIVSETYDIVTFHGRDGQLVLWTDNPGKAEFRDFLALVIARIRSAQQGEKTILRRLRQAGIIDEWQYEQAVDLFKQNDDSIKNV
jgi:hypothetical protein